MHTNNSTTPQARARALQRSGGAPRFKLTAGALAVFGVAAILAGQPVQAAEEGKTLTELQAENLRLKKELETLK